MNVKKKKRNRLKDFFEEVASWAVVELLVSIVMFIPRMLIRLISSIW